MDLISSATDICILHGICDYFGKIIEIDLESRRRTASVLLTPRVSETASLSRASAADNPSNYAWIAEGDLSARASIAKSVWFVNSARTAEGTSWLIPNKETTEAVVERANVTKDKELSSV